MGSLYPPIPKRKKLNIVGGNSGSMRDLRRYLALGVVMAV